jgi:D-ribose pyranase
MLQKGILNPDILHLIARVRHTNTLVIADWAFPFWPEIETVDISLTQGVPTVLQVLELLKTNFKIGRIIQAEEFLSTNPRETVNAYNTAFQDIPNVVIERPAHLDFKKLIPDAIGLIRTGDTTAYGNIILESV